MNETRTHVSTRSLVTLLGVACVLYIVLNSHGQVQSVPGHNPVYEPSSLEALTKVKSGAFAPVHIELLTERKVPKAIPLFEEQFTLSKDKLLKGKLAQGLVKLGVRDDTYWNYLVQLATPAIASDAPNFISHDPAGKAVRGLSIEFLYWSKLHRLSAESAATDAAYIYPAEVTFLASSKDPRAVPLLKTALLSKNPLIVAAAARGLADIGDSASISAIIDACQKVPRDEASVIAAPLVYFDDVRANEALARYVSPEVSKELRSKRAAGETPFH